MKKYYLNRDEENLGPFNLEELREHKITQDTMVWFIGLDGWTPAKDIRELHILFNSLPRHELTGRQGLENYYISKMEKEESFFLKHIDKFLLLFVLVFAGIIILFFMRLKL